MNRSFKIVFMGTPAYAVPTLSALHRSRHEIARVVTQPDRPKGRGRRVSPPPVKTTALAFGYPVDQPQKIKTDAFVDSLARLEPDIFVVVAYGRILPKSILAVPSIGCVNVHASLLPKYRGAAPIQWALIKGETETGVTTILMDEGMDTGDILLSAREPIEAADSTASLHDRLADLGAQVLIATLDRLAEGTLTPTPQDHRLATTAPMLKKDDGRIDWTLSASAITSFIRGMNPWPGAFTFNEGKRLKFYRAEALASDTDAAPGTVLPGFADELRVAAGSGALSIREIQGESGKRLPADAFLRGHPLPTGTLLK